MVAEGGLNLDNNRQKTTVKILRYWFCVMVLRTKQVKTAKNLFACISAGEIHKPKMLMVPSVKL